MKNVKQLYEEFSAYYQQLPNRCFRGRNDQNVDLYGIHLIEI